jgi:hypothetical protein
MCRWRSPTRRWSPTHRSRSRPPVLGVPLEEAEAPLEGSPPRRPLEEGRGRRHPASMRRGREGVPGRPRLLDLVPEMRLMTSSARTASPSGDHSSICLGPWWRHPLVASASPYGGFP